MKTAIKTLFCVFSMSAAVSTGHAALPAPGMQVEAGRTALVVTDPQNDFLSPKGVTWGVVGNNVKANKTVENIETLFREAKANGIPVFVSPHYYYPHDHGWRFEGALEKLMHDIGMFDRKSPLSVEGFAGSGPDWLERYKPYINDGHTTVTSPHKIYGPETNDLVLQLRKQGIDKVILAGMSANLCTESHLRELLEQGFEVAVVSDGTAAAQVDEGDGYAAALVNFRFLASAVWTTQEAKRHMASLAPMRSSSNEPAFSMLGAHICSGVLRTPYRVTTAWLTHAGSAGFLGCLESGLARQGGPAQHDEQNAMSDVLNPESRTYDHPGWLKGRGDEAAVDAFPRPTNQEAGLFGTSAGGSIGPGVGCNSDSPIVRALLVEQRENACFNTVTDGAMRFEM